MQKLISFRSGTFVNPEASSLIFVETRYASRNHLGNLYSSLQNTPRSLRQPQFATQQRLSLIVRWAARAASALVH